MKKLLFLFALLCVCTIPARAQLVITSDPFGNLVAPVDQGGWHDFKATLTRNVTFTFVGVPPPSQSQVTVTFIQDATGARVVTFGGNIVSPGCLINGTPSSTTFCFFHFDSTTNLWTWIPTSGSASQLHGNGPPSNPCTNGFIYTDDTTGNTYSCKVSTWVSLSLTSGSGAPTNPCVLNSGYTDTTTGNFYSCNAGTWLFVGPVTTTTGPSCSTDTFTSTPTYTFTGADQCHIMTLTGNVTSITIAGTPANHTQLFLKFPEDGTGGRTFLSAFPGTFVFPTGFTGNTGANNQNNMAWVFDGTLWRPTVDFGGGSGGGGSPGGVANDTQCNSGANAFKACANNGSVLYVSNVGNDANDGKTWDKAKLTIMAAVCALPGGNCGASPKIAGAGTVYFTSAVACNANVNAGCWIASSGDSAWPTMATAQGGAAAWQVTPIQQLTGLNLVCAPNDLGPAHMNTPSCQVNGPNGINGFGNMPALWISGNSNAPIYIKGLSTGADLTGQHIASNTWGRIGIDSTTGKITGTPTTTQTSSVTIENISTGGISGAGGLGFGPQLAVGNGFWLHIWDSSFAGNISEGCQVSALSRTSNVVTLTTANCQASSTQCPFVNGDRLSIRDSIGDGTFNGGNFIATSSCGATNTVTFNQTGPNGSAGAGGIVVDDRAFGIVMYGSQIEMHNLHQENGGGFHLNANSNTNLDVHDVYMEGGGQFSQPNFWLSGGGCVADLSGIYQADTPALPAVINDACTLTLRTFGSTTTSVRGGASVINSGESFHKNAGLLAVGQAGFANNIFFESQNDIGRRAGGPSTVEYPNLAFQIPSQWINMASGISNSGYTVASAKTDPFGGTGAYELDSTGGAVNVGVYSAASTVNVNDLFEFGAWVRAVNGTFSSGSNPFGFGLVGLGSGAGDLCYGGLATVSVFTPYVGDGNWFWLTGSCQIWANPTTAELNLTLFFDATHAIQVYRPWVIKIPAGGGISGTETANELNSITGGHPLQAVPGDVAFMPNQRLCIPSNSITNEFCEYIVHNNTANRTVTAPDFSGTMCLTTNCPSFGSPPNLYDNFNRSLLNTAGPCPSGSCWNNDGSGALPVITGNQITMPSPSGATFSGALLNYPSVGFGPYEFGEYTITGDVGSNSFYTIHLNYGATVNYDCQIDPGGLANLTRIMRNGVVQVTGTFSAAVGDIFRCESTPAPTLGQTLINLKKCVGGVFPCTTLLTFIDASPGSGAGGLAGFQTQTFTGGFTPALDNFNGGTLNPSFASLDTQQVFSIFQQFPGLVVGALPTTAFSPAFGQLQTNTVTATTSVSTGATPPNCTAGGGTAGTDCLSEGTITTNTAGTQLLWANAVAHELGLETNGSTTLSGILVRDMPTPVLQTGQTAAITTASLCASSPSACSVAGQYHIHVNLWGSGTACTTPGPGGTSFTLTWTDEAGVSHVAVVVPLISQTGATSMALQSSAPTFPFQTALANESASGDLTISTNGSLIQYATSYTACTAGTGTYNLRASVTHLVSP